MKYTLNEKYLLEENNLLYEADDWNVGDEIKHNDKITKFLELLKKKQQEIKDFSDNFVSLMGIGFDVSKTINDIEGKYKPLAQKLDNLNNIIPDIIKKLENISDETTQNNKSILSTVELLSEELDMLKLKEVSNTKQLDKLSHSLDTTIDAIIKNLDNLNTILDNTVNTTADSTKAPDNWQEYLNKAKKAGNLDDAWNYYLKTVWKENADKIKKLGSAFRIEIMYFGAEAYKEEDKTGNPFITFINYLLKPEGEITANLDMIKENAYAHIHNSFNRGFIVKNDLIGESILGFNNILFKADLYTFTGKEIDEFLERQFAILNKESMPEKERLDCLYTDESYKKLRSLENLKGFMTNKDIDVKVTLTDKEIPALATKIATVVNNLPATDITSRVRNLIELLGLNNEQQKAVKAIVLNKYDGLNKVDSGVINYNTKDRDTIQNQLGVYKKSVNSMANLVMTIIPKLKGADTLKKKEENATTKA